MSKLKPVRKIVATTGQYTDANGDTKNRYQNIGTLFKRDDDSLCMKFDCMPVGNEWNGWANAYPLDDDKKAPAPARQPDPAQAPAPEFEDDIPF